MRRLTRREFLRLAAAGAAGVVTTKVLASCAPASEVALSPPGPITPSAGPMTPTAKPEAEILRNENVPGFYVRYYNPFPAPDPTEWRLTVDGLVSNPLRLSLEDVQDLPTVSEVRRMKCVECWSAQAKWEGFDLASLMEAAEPEPEAQWVHMFCADDYYESQSIEELMRDGVMFAYGMNGELLPAKYGSPLRLVAPSKYGYKWAKAIVHVEFAANEKIGYWPTVGPYTSSGAILGGRDLPLDIPGGARSIGEGEVIYPEDLEAQ
jgi:DMSO/TMAO reductase YedYZ molybdopterin-dependent catalytic subunit